MSGTEELIQRGYLEATKHPKNALQPETFGDRGILKLGQTTFQVLKRFLDIDVSAARDFEPHYWSKPANMSSAKPDSLVVTGRSISAVVEHKSDTALRGGTERRKGLEQLYAYMLVCKAPIGALTDGTRTLWLHNADPYRRLEIKLVKENGLLCTRPIDSHPQNLEYVATHLNHITDEISQPPSFDPSTLAKSIWQDVYIATRQDPEKCFQTFVELFMYKLLSDYSLLPANLTIDNLVGDPTDFAAAHGLTQIQYYFSAIRPQVKSHLFVPMNTDAQLSGLVGRSGVYRTTKGLLPTLDASGGKTSVIDGHAFHTQPVDYNGAFVGILKKLNALPHITHLDPGFKSRVYEQFLRRDPNTSKVTGKYFTPRNVVKAIVQMAEVASLHSEAVICDPACGVGGFITETILELERQGISNFQEDQVGRIVVERKLIGLEVLEDVVCLAKANMLLHCIELYNNFSNTARYNFSHLLADIFVHCHEDRTLGTLKHPCVGQVDLIMANPPYIVSGTQNVTAKIRDAGLTRFYDAGGSGLESRFVNWIVNALKRGGRAFVVLPKSMLARVNHGFKAWIRKECIIDALVYLPERSFYISPNPTYVLAVTRKHDENMEQEDPIFCYYVRDIGETRDTQREPARNDLVEMVDEFRLFRANKCSYTPTTKFCKVLSPSALDAKLRWDVDYLWTPRELAELGVMDTNVLPYDAIVTELQAVLEELTEAKSAIDSLVTSAKEYAALCLGDETRFRIYRGKRVTHEECKKHRGDIPVVASGRHESSYLGTISEAYLRSKGLAVFEQNDNIMTVGATGAVGCVHLRRERKWFLHDDALAVEVTSPGLLPAYVRYALQRAIDVASFDYTAKLYAERLKALHIDVPTDESGRFDMAMQQQIAQAYQHEEETNARLRQLAAHFQSVSVQFSET